MTLDKFCYHIASHGCVYSRADIQAILILAVDCLREQLLNGQQIQMGDLGVFSNSIRSSAPIRWQSSLWRTSRGERTVGSGRPFQQPAPRCRIPTGSHAQGSRRSSEGIEGRKTTVDLTGNSSAAGIAADDADAPAFQPPPANRQTKIADRLVPLHRDSMM